jgi:hypothetical protein
MYTIKLYMKFPITRESLQAYDQTKEEAERKEEFIQCILESDITRICNTVKGGMPEYSRAKRIIWQTSKCLNGQRIYYPTRNGIIHPKNELIMDEYLPRFIQKLQETFIGCDISIDPLKHTLSFVGHSTHIQCLLLEYSIYSDQ